MFLKFYHHLYPLSETKSSFVNKFDESNSLDIFEMVAHTNDLVKELVNGELMMFSSFQVDAKDVKCLLEWWRKHKSMF
jgi:hypothetical protein